METVALTETESRYFGDLFLCCDIEKTGKIPMLKATELYRSANLSNDVIREITSLSGIPQTALHISRSQFYSCLKLIAAYQASMPLRTELISSSVNLPLPKFNWKLEPSSPTSSTMGRVDGLQTNGLVMGMGGVNSGSSKGVAVPRRGSWFDTTTAQLVDPTNSDVPSTDSEVEHNESSSGREPHRHRGGGAAGGGSPEAWSTNSDSPTPTNSVAERPWAKESLWQGLLGDEHRQLLGTEEESSDRHSSDDDNEGEPFYYQITPEQREYYHKQFKAVQHDPNGLLSGHIARVFFEKSQIPVKELRHIWQLCDVTRDGALSLAEFTAAMHLVVLRRHNLPLPAVLPACLHPNVLMQSAQPPQTVAEPPEADLLHLNDDDEDDNTDNTIKQAVVPPTTISSAASGNDSEHKRVPSRSEKNPMSMSTLSTSSQASTGSKQAASVVAGQGASLSPPPAVRNRSVSNSPSVAEPTTTPPPLAANLWKVSLDEWTKYMDSPVSDSPGPKPVNFDMKRTAQAVVSDPQILHPVPLRVTPVAGAEVVPVAADEDVTMRIARKTENLVYDASSGVLRDNNDASPKQQTSQPPPTSQVPTLPTAMTSSHHRDSLQNNDLRAIQRPQAKKLPVKNIGAIPPPPQREPSIGANNAVGGDTMPLSDVSSSLVKKDPPPLPPPRPHRHGRSSSLDLNKFKLGGQSSQPEITAQASFDLQTTGFADFAHFPATSEQPSSAAAADHTGSATLPANTQPPRYNAISSLQSTQRVSAFEVYRKPNTPRNSQSPDFNQHNITPLPPPPLLHQPNVAATSSTSIDADATRHVSFKHDNKNMPDVLRHLREQNSLLLRLCSDLSEELSVVQRRKEEMRIKLESNSSLPSATAPVATATTASSSVPMAPVTANTTGGSASSGVHSNV